MNETNEQSNLSLIAQNTRESLRASIPADAECRFFSVWQREKWDGTEPVPPSGKPISGGSCELREVLLQHFPLLRAKFLTQFFLCSIP
jgi:hypothetical protein